MPWLPREIASCLYERPHELEHIKTVFLLSTSHVAGFLGREDGTRPAWFNRVQLQPVSALTPDLQEHLANVCHVLCLKVRQEVTSEPASKPPIARRSATNWQAGLLCARVIWRTLFAAVAAKAPLQRHVVPVMFMLSCESLRTAARRLLVQVWNEVQVQFTSRVNKHRSMKSRPAWSVLEAMQYQVYGLECGFGVCNPAETPPSSAGIKPAASLQDYMEEVLALRFAVDWLSASLLDAQEFLEHSTKRTHRRPLQPAANTGHGFQHLAGMKESSVDSFAMMWTDDAELRGVASLAARLMDGLEGPAALQFAATFMGQLLLAMWKGLEPMLAHQTSVTITRIAESQATRGTLPAPLLPETDEDASQTAGFYIIANSYKAPSSYTKEMIAALPRGVLKTIIRVQSTFRGYAFRARHFSRARAVAAYCKAVQWPSKELQEGTEGGDPKEKKKRRIAARVDATKLHEEIAEYVPTVSKYLGGDSRKQASSKAGLIKSVGLGSAMRSMRISDEENADRRSWPLPTADHRACADLFALYLYNIYRRREFTFMWQTLCGAYERSMDAYAELLNRNPALKPMLESIAAQLKRGSGTGLDRAFLAKQRKGEDARTHPADAQLFKRSPTLSGEASLGKAEETTNTHGLPVQLKEAATISSATQAFPAALKKSALGTSASAPTLVPALSPLFQVNGEKQDASEAITGEYLTNYIKEMDGDDSQFKDIGASVVPLSTGTSPPRQPPPEFILNEEAKGARSSGVASEGGGDFSRGGSGQATSTKRPRPKLDVPFCLQRVKPIWLPIRAHRFAADRAKVLQLLPQRVLQQYIEFEKQGQYLACIKLLESAIPGSLNVLSPATLVNNKPLLVETVLQLIVGYCGLGLKNQQGIVAVKLITQVLDNMSLSLRDLHPGHRSVLEAYLYDTALSVCYFMPDDTSLSHRAESFFQQASERYLRLGHTNRYCKCCLRGGAVFHGQGNRSEAEYYAQQALKKVSDAGASSMLVICYHNLAVHTVVQERIVDAVSHVRAYVTLLRQLPKLGTSWMQLMDNTQWLILKAQELWPQYQPQTGSRDGELGVPKIAWNKS